VDALAYIGLGLNSQLSAAPGVRVQNQRAGTFRSMFEQIRAQEAAVRRANRNSGW